MDSAREPDDERGRDELGHPCDTNSPNDPLPLLLAAMAGLALEEVDMPPTPEEKALLADAPKGTFALMVVVAALLFVGWAVLYFGRFLGNGLVR